MAILIHGMSGKAEQTLMKERVLLKPKGAPLGNAKRITLYTKNCTASCDVDTVLTFLPHSANLNYYNHNVSRYPPRTIKRRNTNTEGHITIFIHIAPCPQTLQYRYVFLPCWEEALFEHTTPGAHQVGGNPWQQRELMSYNVEHILSSRS